jgi:hypothetical protein
MKALLSLALIAIPPTARACTMVEFATNVAPDFRVKVEFRGRPMPGLRVRTKNASAVTDENGFAYFYYLRSGPDSVDVDVPGGLAGHMALNVTADGPPAVSIPLYWQGLDPIKVHSLKGTLHSPDYEDGKPQEKYTLDLFDLRSGQKTTRQQTNDRGEFDFEISTPGFYMILANSSGQIIVDVDSSARSERIDLNVGLPRCGVLFADRNRCGLGPFSMERLAGQVVDPSGAVIPGALINLFDASNTAVEQMSTDTAGKFASSRNLIGSYELVIERPGFKIYHAMVRLGTARGAQGSLATIALSLGSACGGPNPN